MSKFTTKEIQRHIQEEKRRRTPVDEQKIREAQELNRQHREWLVTASWEEIEQRLSVIGLQPGTPEYEQIRSWWKEVHKEIQIRRKPA